MVCFGKERIGVGYEILVGMGLSFFTIRRYKTQIIIFFSHILFTHNFQMFAEQNPAIVGGLIETQHKLYH